MRIRVKICGMTRGEDVVAAAYLGVDAVGLVFFPGSARHMNPDQAMAVADAAPAFVTVTGLFLNPAREAVQRVLDTVRVDLLQFHGEETPEFCRAFKRPYVKAVPMGEPVNLAAYVHQYADAAALLLDSHTRGEAGGRGASFAWSEVTGLGGPPLILAGGLHAGNVAAAIRIVHPYGVDVSSGVESAPGIKDVLKMTAFMKEVTRVTTA